MFANQMIKLVPQIQEMETQFLQFHHFFLKIHLNIERTVGPRYTKDFGNVPILFLKKSSQILEYKKKHYQLNSFEKKDFFLGRFDSLFFLTGNLISRCSTPLLLIDRPRSFSTRFMKLFTLSPPGGI